MAYVLQWWFERVYNRSRQIWVIVCTDKVAANPLRIGELPHSVRLPCCSVWRGLLIEVLAIGLDWCFLCIVYGLVDWDMVIPNPWRSDASTLSNTQHSSICECHACPSFCWVCVCPRVLWWNKNQLSQGYLRSYNDEEHSETRDVMWVAEFCETSSFRTGVVPESRSLAFLLQVSLQHPPNPTPRGGMKVAVPVDEGWMKHVSNGRVG